MVGLIFLFLNLVSSLFNSESRLEPENAALRQQLTVLRRKVRGRVQFTNSDRLFFIQLYRWFPAILKAMNDHPVLALEISERPAAHRCQPAGADPPDEFGHFRRQLLANAAIAASNTS